VTQGNPKRWSKHSGKGAVFRSLDADGVDSFGFSVPPHLVQENSFAHAAQTYQHHAFCRPAQAKPIKSYADILPDDASTS
jgi:hypothetical protein